MQEEIKKAIESTTKFIKDLEECLNQEIKGFGYCITIDPKQELSDKYIAEIKEDLDKEYKILKQLKNLK